MFQLGFKLKVPSLFGSFSFLCGHASYWPGSHLAQRLHCRIHCLASKTKRGELGEVAPGWSPFPVALVHRAGRLKTHPSLGYPAASLQGSLLESEVPHRLFYAFAPQFVASLFEGCAVWRMEEPYLGRLLKVRPAPASDHRLCS